MQHQFAFLLILGAFAARSIAYIPETSAMIRLASGTQNPPICLASYQDTNDRDEEQKPPPDDHYIPGDNPHGPNPHGPDPHGDDPHDEYHDPNLPANNPGQWFP